MQVTEYHIGDKLAEKAPPLFYLLVKYLADCCSIYDITSRTDIWCITEYHIGDKLAEKPRPPGWGKIFWLWIYPFQAILSNFGFCGRKAPSPQDEGKFFDFGSIHFRQFWATLLFVAEKPPPPPPGWGNIFWLWIYPFQVILSKFGFCGREALPLRMREIFLTLDLSISGDFESKFGFCGSKAPPYPGWRKIFWLWIYPFQVILSNFGFCGRKAPSPRMRENFLTLDLSISGDFEQVWFLWQKSPPPHRMRENFLTLDLSISGDFEQVWFLWQKPPPRMRENYLTLDLSISGDFEQVWFLWQKGPPPSFLPFGEILGSCCSTWRNFMDWYFMHHWISHWWQVGRKAPPPPRWGKFFDFRFIHFRLFWASLVFVAEKPPPPPPAWGKFFWLWIYPFQVILSKFGFCGRKAPPPGWGKIFWLWIYPFQAILSNFGFCGRKAPPPRMRENYLTLDLSISGDFEQLWFLWQKSPPPPRMRENFLTLDLSISGDFEQLWFLWQKAPPPPPGWGKIFWLWIYPFQVILSKLWLLWQKSPPPHPPGWGKIFWLWIYPFQVILSNFGFCGRKAPPPQDEGKFFDFGSIHFRQFWASLVFVAEKSPLPGWGKKFWLWIYPFQVILSKFGFCGRKAPLSLLAWGKMFWLWIYPFQAIWASLVFVAEKLPPWGKFFDFGSIFRWFWATLSFWWQKSPPPGWGKIFWLWIYPFQAILSNFGFCGRNPPPPGWGKIFWLWIYPFQVILSKFGFCGRKAPPPTPRMRKIFWLWIFTISGAFWASLVFVAEKPSPPPGWGKIFWLWIYPFQAILSKFGFCGRKGAPPHLFCLLVRYSAHVAAHDITSQTDILCIIEYHIGDKLVFVAEKPPPPRMREIFLTSDLSISGNFEQLWFLWQKSHPPTGWGKIFDFGSIHFRWFWASLVFVAEKPPTRMRENFLTLDLSISGDFEQVMFLWQKSPTPTRMREIFWLWIYPFQVILSKFGFWWQKSPPPQDEGKFFDFGSIHFRWFWASLVFCGRKAPPQDEGKNFDFGSIHFRWFWASLVFVAEKAPPPPRSIFSILLVRYFGSCGSTWCNFTLDWYFMWSLNITLVISWQKSPPPGWGKIFWLWIYPFQAILSNFGFCGRNPPPRMRENFLTLDLSISGDFEQVWFLWQKSPPPPPGWGKIFWLWIYPFQAILSKFGFCGRKAPPPPGWGKIFWLWIYPFQAILSKFGFCGKKASPLFSAFWWDTRLMLQHMT